jgi:hypothetical protein
MVVAFEMVYIFSVISFSAFETRYNLGDGMEGEEERREGKEERRREKGEGQKEGVGGGGREAGWRKEGRLSDTLQVQLCWVEGSGCEEGKRAREHVSTWARGAISKPG